MRLFLTDAHWLPTRAGSSETHLATARYSRKGVDGRPAGHDYTTLVSGGLNQKYRTPTCQVNLIETKI